MKKINGKIACGILAVSMFAASFTGCGKLDGTQTVATVGDEKVTLGMANYMLRDYQAQAEAYYQLMAMNYGMEEVPAIWTEKGQDGKTMAESAKDNVMKDIENLYAMKAHAEDYGVTISEEEQKKIEEAAKGFIEENSEEALEELAVSEADLITYLQLITYRAKMHEPMLADVDREVTDEEIGQSKVTLVKVSTSSIEKDEDGNIIELTEEEKAEKKALAEEVRKKVAESDNIAEADMGALAKEVNEKLYAFSPNFTTAGSETDAIDKNVSAAVKDLNDGELVPTVVDGTDGYYVVRLDLKHDEEATKNKKEAIISGREKEVYDALITAWLEENKLKVDEKVWEKVEISDEKAFQYKIEEDTETEEAAEDDTEENDTAEETEE